jgi:hypothetical protein
LYHTPRHCVSADFFPLLLFFFLARCIV